MSAHAIRWGIVGCGNVTEVKSGPAFQKVEGSQLVAVMRRDGDKARDYAQRHGVARAYDDGEALIADAEVDAVYIATPPDSHEHYTRLAAQAGKPVYVEKPMARSHAECLRMVEVCKTAGVPLFVAYYRRRLPRFLRVKQLVDEGALGTIRYASVRCIQHARTDEVNAARPEDLPWRVLPQIAGAGKFLDLASHALDALDYILGPVAAAQGSASNLGGYYPAEDTVTMDWRFESGAHGTGTWCFVAGQREDQMEITGDQGCVRWSCFGTEPVVLETAEGRTEFPEETPPHVQQPLVQSIVEQLQGRGTCPSTGESGARTSWVMDQPLAAYRAEHGFSFE